MDNTQRIVKSSDGVSYTANQPYNQEEAYRHYSAVLEPANYDENGTIKLTPKTFQLSSATYGNPDFLRALSKQHLAPLAYISNKCKWKYDSRHQAQFILPFFALGPAPVARNEVYIRDSCITMVIAVRSAQAAKAQPKWLDPSRFDSCKGIETATFDVDSPFDLITHIKPMLRMITEHLESQTVVTPVQKLDEVGGRILFFCESGNDRSPVLIAAYLMLVYGITWHESLNLIHSFRFSVSLNGGMNDMLKTFGEMIQAESDTAAAVNGFQNSTPMVSVPKNFKRTIDDAYDSDEAMTDDDEVEIRSGIAPFIDTT